MDDVVRLLLDFPGPMPKDECVRRLGSGRTSEEVMSAIRQAKTEGLLAEDAEGRLVLTPAGKRVAD
jgi:hypothetical protein